MGVIVLAVMLIAGIVSLMDSIPLSIQTIYSYSRHYLGMSPRGDAEETPRIKAKIEKEAPVPLDRVIVARAESREVKSIVGGWPFVVLGLNQSDMTYYIDRLGGGQIEGRLPKPGEPEMLVSEQVLRNLKLKLGDNILGPEERMAYSPKEVKVVGVIHSKEWMMLMPIEYLRDYHFPPIDVLIVFAKDASDQKKLDLWAEEAFRGKQARVYAWHILVKETDEMFGILYSILNVVILTLVSVITLMMGMLMNIYFSQRVQEFGLLQALGYTKKKMLSRVLLETILVVIGGWILGTFVSFSLLSLVKAQLMDPNAFALDVFDPAAYRYTIPVPIAILLVSAATIIAKFRGFDPVGIVERRLA
jgi:ABC-type lipoprotein release transport system permease subunit